MIKIELNEEKQNKQKIIEKTVQARDNISPRALEAPSTYYYTCFRRKPVKPRETVADLLNPPIVE